MAPQDIKLIYFNARGRAEISRLVLTAAGQTFQDIRLTRDEWTSKKQDSPFGQLPVLEIDGRKYAQSLAIATYLAREFGLYGQTNEDGLAIDQVVQLSVDFSSSLSRSHRERDEAKKAKLLKKVKEDDAPRYLSYFEKLLRENGSGYFVTSSMTLADICVYELIDSIIKRGVINLQQFPLVQGLIQLVENNNNIKNYLDTRKQTEH
ncbi:Glutathione S-transferase 3 [Bulinus truncatus]|nr:Glutathione S-transferase 3 [Bulinus truncatus]